MAAERLAMSLRRPILAAIDEYEEVEMQAIKEHPHHWLSAENGYWNPRDPSFTVYRKKQKPEPESVTVSRETLVVLLGFARDVPNKDMVLDKACVEAEERL